MGSQSSGSELTFRVMGTDAHVVVIGGPAGLVQRVPVRLEELESRWSRFRATSELARLNAAAGAPVAVSPSTFELIAHAVAAWRSTDGAFDPTTLAALVVAGYDRDFTAVPPEGPAGAEGPVAAPGCDGIVLDPVVRSVTLPVGVSLDLGGIGKGYAADQIVAELLDSGARGAMVNLGGDLRVAGEAPAPTPDAWGIAVDAPKQPGELPALTLALSDGAVATTSRLRRAWRRGGELRHHVIDPHTGRPSATPWCAVTVIAATGEWAEPLATAAFLATDVADATARLARHDATGIVFTASGHPILLDGAGPFLRPGGFCS